ncbi:flagellar motor protein MotD [Pelomicrobium methylotrophicum]|uniref:Flagellar motor protein MotD n=1 Tax=Pelomicrobium methylotrophicum TaxID=2602750 RepID=A0A5C7EL71_9PROT|nr:flagellar motor protein MotD [Pelomicrobium methylotrophicum]TXF11832.1 flagellar motor protein MotD [Pelomicrobium methylotrophicum]
MPRRRRHEDHENHERWMVSYADFITLLFAFFVVMYAISSVNEGKYRVLSESLLSAFRNVVHSSDLVYVDPRPAGRIVVAPAMPRPATPAEDAERRREAERMRVIARDILKALEPLVQERQVRVTETRLGIAVEINAAVLFAPGRARLEANSERVLRAVAAVLRDDDHLVRVEGHTDDVPIATREFPSNWELSTARAASVVRVFMDEGVEGRRLSAVGYSSYRPVASNDTPEGRSRNRRVTVMILARDADEVRDLPVENGREDASAEEAVRRPRPPASVPPVGG